MDARVTVAVIIFASGSKITGSQINILSNTSAVFVSTFNLVFTSVRLPPKPVTLHPVLPSTDYFPSIYFFASRKKLHIISTIMIPIGNADMMLML